MKLAVFLGLTAAVSAENLCLYCKHMDSEASWLYSYSYCAATQTCMADEWNYINKWCESKWIPGWMVDIDKDCDAKNVSIQDFVAVDNFVKEQREFNLKAGQQGTLTIDARAGMVRVMFSKTAGLGVLYNGYQNGNPITIPAGEY